MKVSRKKLMFAGITTAAFIGASSVAFACLVVKGQVTLTTASGSGDTLRSNGLNQFHGICVSPRVAAGVSRSARVTVAVAADSVKCGTNPTLKLASGNAEVKLQHSNIVPGWTRPAPGSTWTFQTNSGCYSGNPLVANYTLSTTFSISTAGAATANFVIPSTANLSAANQAAHICVRDSAGNGAFAPLVIS